MSNGPIAVPSMRGMQGAFTDYAVGAGGGLLFAISRSIFGSGFFGSLIAAVLAGSVIKGDRGTAVATVAGFMALSQGDLFGGGDAEADDSAADVM